MKNTLDKIKQSLNQNISLKPKIWALTALVLIFSLYVSYNVGETHNLNQLVFQKAQSEIAELNQSISNINAEIDDLSTQKETINTSLSDKAEIQNSMQDYSAKKESYENQVQQLTKDIAKLDSSIQQKQAELNKKKADKQEQLRLAAEKKAAEEASNTTTDTVYITNTGKKYHRSGCQYLRKSKIAISLENARSRGYTPCSKCF